MNLYRPQNLSKKFIMQERLIGGGRVNYNFSSRIKWYPVGWTLNKIAISNQFRKLHYLACHSPEPVQKSWKNAYNLFYKKHFGTENASITYLNKYSCHSWL